MIRVLPLLLLIGCGEELAGDAANGEVLFAENCASCHGDAGVGGSGPALTGESEEAGELIDVITNGEDEMPGFGETLTEQEIADIAAYVQSISTGEEDEEDDD